MPDYLSNLYITDHGTSIGCTGERLIIRNKKKTVAEFPVLQIRQIIIFGNASLSTQAINLVLKKGISVFYLSGAGAFRGKLEPDTIADGNLREKQTLIRMDREKCVYICREIIRSKMHNAIMFCSRKKNGNNLEKNNIIIMKEQLLKIDSTDSIESLRGHEGTFARLYFDVFRNMISFDINSKKRQSKNPTDPVNTMLNFSYSLLYGISRSMIHITGLDPYQGFLHSNQYGHASLASDLMESFRPIISDSIVRTAINKLNFIMDDFTKTNDGLRMKKPVLKKFLELHDQRMNTKALDERSGRKIDYYKIIEAQARELAHFIRGSKDIFSPFMARG